MENKKIAAILFKIQMDDLKDADMLADYAKEVYEYGDNSLAESIVGRAKLRLQHMSECDKHIQTVMQRIAMESPEEASMVSEDNLYSIMYKDYLTTWTEKVRMKLENF